MWERSPANTGGRGFSWQATEGPEGRGPDPPRVTQAEKGGRGGGGGWAHMGPDQRGQKRGNGGGEPTCAQRSVWRLPRNWQGLEAGSSHTFHAATSHRPGSLGGRKCALLLFLEVLVESVTCPGYLLFRNRADPTGAAHTLFLRLTSRLPCGGAGVSSSPPPPLPHLYSLLLRT